MGLYYGICVSLLAVTVCTGIILHYKAQGKLNIFLRVVSLVSAAAFFFRFMLGNDVVATIVNFNYGDLFSSRSMAALALFQVWFMFAAEMLIILAPFFKVRIVPALVAFFALPVFALNFVMIDNHILGIVGAVEGFNVRAMLIAVETGLSLGFSFVYLLKHYKEVILKKVEWVWFALAIVGMIIAALPTYAFQYLLKPLGYYPDDLNFYHRLLLYPIAVIPITLYVLLKDKPLESRRMALMYYAWLGLVCFSENHRFGDLFGPGWVTALPLHLCNTAMYITPLCLTFRLKKLFYFTYFINVLGAFFALTMPDYGALSIFQSGIWHFYLNHYQAFFMPLIVVGLGIFRRPRWKEFKYSLVAFSVYFFLIIVINAWFTNYNPGVDYFYLNSDFIAGKLGKGAERLRDIVWEFKIGNLNFKLYPLYQSLYYIVYIGLSFAMWFIYELAYSAISGWEDIGQRNKKIKADRLALEARLNGRSIEEPINMDNVNKLVLKKFTKRYGHSDVYAVKDADLEVCGGEIYGFLGPNGAGKSTIIKSIVGIQTITDGAIEVCGYDVATQSVMAKRQIGFVPDHYALYERLTAREYINYIADLYEVSKADRDERLDRFIKLFEFETAIDNPIRTYSHGMKQKVTIMSALIHDPKVWILDEPLTGLDPTSIFQVKECMKEHAAKGNIVFFSSHIIDVVERICDKIAIIRKGQIQCVRDVKEMERNGESLEQFYMSVINGKEVKPISVKPDEKPAEVNA